MVGKKEEEEEEGDEGGGREEEDEGGKYMRLKRERSHGEGDEEAE